LAKEELKVRGGESSLRPGQSLSEINAVLSRQLSRFA